MKRLVLPALLLMLCGCEVKVEKPADVKVVKPPDVTVVKPPDVKVKPPDVNVEVNPKKK